jgi:hypothetical protein
MFNGRKLVIATKHQKEKVITPIFEKELNVKCFVASNLDTDELGTFTGEIERKDDPVTTARKKCLLAMQLNQCDLAIASEGSFGPHPTIGIINADDEILVLIDKKNNLEFISRELSTQTNFNGSEIKSYTELEKFSKLVKFPTHGIILRRLKDAKEDIYKGITTEKDLKKAYDFLMDKYSSVYAETDMRALYNPTRMQVIEKTTKKLIEKIKTLCPKCSTPGFSITDAKPGLVCQNCNLPTRSTLLHILSCQSCGFKQEKMYPSRIFSEDPMYCDFCNP